MKLTLSISGGFTGLTKTYSVDIRSLDKKTRDSLVNYINKKSSPAPATPLAPCWSLDDNKEITIETKELTPELKVLFEAMKKELRYAGK